jgi:putative addiction module component (TIGR02574 family)
MMNTYEEIISAALSLPPDSRAMLAEHLLDSLNGEDQKRVDALWVAEAERRDQEIEDGIVTAIPGEEVMERLRSRYRGDLASKNPKAWAKGSRP